MTQHRIPYVPPAQPLNEEATGLYRTLARGGHGLTPVLRSIFTRQGHELYRVLTATQRTLWRSMIVQQHTEGRVRHTLLTQKRDGPINALVEWGAIEGTWTGKTFHGSIGLGMLRKKPQTQPKDVAGRFTPIGNNKHVTTGEPPVAKPAAVSLSMPVALAVGASLLTFGLVLGCLCGMLIS